MPGTLYLVATPIGNLQDITLRALETLRTVDLIACEDTRHTRNLLNHFRISNKTVSYHEHNEQERSEEFVDRLVVGENIAIVSDAGTPGICDPGFRIVQRASEIGAAVVPIPGAAAFVSGVIVSGLPTDSLFFGGFLPSKKGERRKRLEEVRDIPATLLFYEAPHRLSASIGDCLAVLGDRKASISRELTKLHEETIRGTLSFLFAHFQKAKVKGEIVISIDRADENIAPVKTETSIEAAVRSYELAGLDHKAALKRAAKDLGISKSEAYRMLLPK
ncbi:MAG: 16S rRNA (cytidine(1402)-2'-O)-methyltransferase [Pyrinomonadaceae bacterium]